MRQALSEKNAREKCRLTKGVTKIYPLYPLSFYHKVICNLPTHINGFFFAGNTDQDTVVYHNLSSPIRERYIRFQPTSWIVGVSMRVELYGFLGEVKFWISENSWVVQQMICNSLIFYPLCEIYCALLFYFVFLNIWASQKCYSIFHFTLMVLLALNYNLSFNSQDSDQKSPFRLQESLLSPTTISNSCSDSYIFLLDVNILCRK